ncbi:GA module-containing protein [Gardnerella pickettii]|uniref:GA module-containing protein n=1 Tax=Gardnerella pickettii TaxID=2914924 RepID=UPI0002635A1A|nr:GA module-containing protein [Gardnerella pickettii]EIK86069.1 sugar-binding domain protein [Gardnerella pickettii 00703C2mash]
MSKKIHAIKHYSGINAGVGADSQPVLSKSVCAAMLAGAMVLGGGVFVSSPAYADGYVDGTGNNVYYGFKTDAKYAEAHFNIDVEYYDTFEHAKAGGTEGIDPLGKFVRVHYLSNCHNNATADDWRFRPMWWFGVPAGLKDPQDIQFKRIEKLTKNGKEQVKPAGSSQYITTDANGYGVVSDKHFNSPKEWTNISNYYFSDENILASKGWKQLMGLGTKDNKGYDNAGNTAQQWEEYQKQTQGLKGIFVDWESAGQRWYDMTYVSEMEDKAWKERDTNPLRFAAGVYRFAGNWHYAVGQKHNTPKIADHFKLAYPEVTKVKKTNDLSDDEQKTIKEKIEKANENTKYFKELVADNGVVVNKDGSATITFKDKTTRTIPASLLVAQDESDSDRYKPVMPDRIPVVNPDSLSDDDKTAVIDAFKKANPDSSEFSKHLAKDNAIAFDKDGKNLVVTYEDGSKATIPASELVFQGPKISDWAPYVVPDAIEVTDPAKLNAEEQKKVTDAFDAANADLDVYNAAKKDGKTPVSFDKDFKNAIITWADGSTTEIPSWQFLKQKAAEQNPTPKPPAPTPAAEKEFIVEPPEQQSGVDFDPFNATQKDVNDNKTQLDAIVSQFMKKLKAKDAKNPDTSVTIKSLEFKIEDGKGVVVFHADNYKDATYPMSVFLKQKAAKQTPKETEHNPQGKTQYKYKVKPVVVNGDSPTPLEKVQALKAFIKSNYGTDLTYDTTVIDTYSLKDSDKPVDGTQGMWRFVQGEHDGAGILTIGVADDGSLEIQGYEKGDTSSKKLFTVPASELYVKKNSNIDHTLSDLKQQAKDLLKKRTDEGLTKDDLKRAGITDADKLDNNAINGMDEKALRDLIRKLTDAEKAERKYNPIPEIEVTDPENLSEADFKKAAEAFLKANYDGTDSLAGDKAPYNVPTSLTPKTDTVKMELSSTSNANGIAKVTYKNSDFTTLVFQDSANNDLFSVKVTYKKAGTPAPTPDAGQLQQMKDDAKKIIDRNPKLTEEQKTQYKNEIDNAKGADDIQNILKKANEQAGKNNVTPEQLKEKEKKDKENKEKEQKKEEDKKQEDQKKQELQDKKKKASDAIDGLGNLTQDEKDKLKEKLNGKSGDATKPGAKTPEEVQQILDEANNLNEAHKDVSAGALPFLSHGNSSSEDDKALKELIGSDPSKKDAALTALEDALAKKDPAATAEEIKNDLDAAKRQNAINEQNAKNAGIAKLDAKKAELDAAYKALNDEQKAKAKDKYEAATKAIDDAKNTVNSATKPSDIKNAVDGVKTSFDDANKAIEDAKGKRDTSQNTYDDQSVLNKEKEDQKKRIQDSDLPDAEKQKAIDDINDAKKIGDPTAIANRALKAKKIEDAKKQIAALDHLNNAQKEAFKKIIEDTDASDHKNADGTTSDDIDDALANATATDTAMARLEKLKEIADKFAKGDKYKGLQEGNEQKKAFDDAATAAGAVLDKANGDPKDADQVNELYKDLLKAMQAIDDKAKGAGVITDALQAEVDNDSKLKPTPADPNDSAKPATPGDSLYTTASKEKKEAFDKALSDAEAALKKAKEDNENDKNLDSTPRTPEQEAKDQQAVDDALQKLENARKALDGVDTKPLQDEIDKDSNVKNSDRYTYSTTTEKKTAFDKALQDAKDLIDKLTGTKKAAAGEEDVTTKTQAEKQKLVDDALAKLKTAEEALDGKKPTPGSGSEAGYGVNDNAPTTVDKGELNVQIQGAESDSQPGNAGNGNAGAGVNSGNAGNAANTNAANANANNANGASSAAVNAAVENNPAVKQADTKVSKAQAALDAALAEAKKVAADPNATQAQVDAAAKKLSAARKALADAQANAAKVRAAVRSRVIKGMRSRGSASTATGANVATAGLMATMIAAIGGAFVTRRMRTKHANRD